MHSKVYKVCGLLFFFILGLHFLGYVSLTALLLIGTTLLVVDCGWTIYDILRKHTK